MSELKRQASRYQVGKLCMYRLDEETGFLVSQYGPCWVCQSATEIVAFDYTRPLSDNIGNYHNVCTCCVDQLAMAYALIGETPPSP